MTVKNSFFNLYLFMSPLLLVPLNFALYILGYVNMCHKSLGFLNIFGGLFCYRKIFSFSLLILSASKFVSPDITKVKPIIVLLVLTGIYLFSTFISLVFMTFLFLATYRWFCFGIQSCNVYTSIGIFNLFTFNVIANIFGFNSEDLLLNFSLS